jgi:spermidine/putrescine transport system substrate-binding protein
VNGGEPLPADLFRGLTQPRMSRRRLLQLGGLSALGAALTTTAAGCSIAGAPHSALGLNAARKQIIAFWDQHAKKTGHLDFANWPLYIDVSDKNKSDHPTIDMFTKQTGISVKYSEVIQQVDTYFGKIQPELAQGQGTGYDLMVITNGLYLDKLIELDYLVPLDQRAMVNFYANASSLALNPSFDRGNVYTMPWQSGITGIGYNPKKLGRKIDSWQDLQDPALRGKIGMFGDTEDMPGCAMLAVGVNPETSTPADWRKAAAWLKKQQPLVRKYYEQDYIDPLSKGDLYATMAWSGDIFQANASGATLEFVVPKEGAMVWSDNMCIPAHAAHPRDAMTYMDWVYQPKIGALIAEYVNYITPVATSRDYIRQEAKTATGDDKSFLDTLVNSPLVYPSEADFSKLHRYRVLTKAEQAVWNQLFEPIYQS